MHYYCLVAKGKLTCQSTSIDGSYENDTPRYLLQRGRCIVYLFISADATQLQVYFVIILVHYASPEVASLLVLFGYLFQFGGM